MAELLRDFTQSDSDSVNKIVVAKYPYCFSKKGLSRSISFALDKDKERGRPRGQVDTSIYEDTLLRPVSPSSEDSLGRSRRQGSLSPGRVQRSASARKAGVISTNKLPIQHTLRCDMPRIVIL